MTVQDFIDKLNEIEDKTMEVVLYDSGFTFPFSHVEVDEDRTELRIF